MNEATQMVNEQPVEAEKKAVIKVGDRTAEIGEVIHFAGRYFKIEQDENTKEPVLVPHEREAGNVMYRYGADRKKTVRFRVLEGGHWVWREQVITVTSPLGAEIVPLPDGSDFTNKTNQAIASKNLFAHARQERPAASRRELRAEARRMAKGLAKQQKANKK